MATVVTKYKKPADGLLADVSLTVDVVKFKPQGSAKDSLEEKIYLRMNGGSGTTSWLRDITGMVEDGLYGQQYAVDGGSNFSATYTDGLDDFGVEGLVTQLEKLAAPTAVDATATGSGNVLVNFVVPNSLDDLIAGYYFWYSTNGTTFTRVQALGSGIAKASLDDVTISSIAKKQYQINVATGAKYFAVTAAGSVVAATAFNESARGRMLTTITVS
jgi:hypothetical protein